VSIYKTSNDRLQVAVHYYLTDGVQITISEWDGEDFITLYDRRVIADSLYEAVTGALMESRDMEWEDADWQCTLWDIYPSDEDEEN
jgi:hypothetical protein